MIGQERLKKKNQGKELKEQRCKEMGGFMVKCKGTEDNVTRMRDISSWSQRLEGGIQFTIQMNSEGKRKGVKRNILQMASIFSEK